MARQLVLNYLQPFSGSSGVGFSGRERHTLVVCSLSIIPPAYDLTGMPLRLEEGYTDLPRSDWADLVKEVATGMSVVPAELSVSVGLEALCLLGKLSKIVGVESCRLCYFPQDACNCPRFASGNVAFQTTQTQIQAPSVVYITANPLGQQTQLSTQAAPAPGAGLLGPPPGLPPLNTQSWSEVATYWTQSEFPAIQSCKANVDLDTPFQPQVTLP